jgi:ABC-type proline/glycine betaine transport system permease subunit
MHHVQYLVHLAQPISMPKILESQNVAMIITIPTILVSYLLNVTEVNEATFGVTFLYDSLPQPASTV